MLLLIGYLVNLSDANRSKHGGGFVRMRRLWLATDGNCVFILDSFSRAQADNYAAEYGLTILKTEENELTELVKRGASIINIRGAWIDVPCSI